jgi:tetratricopeptide (TPR) repeat protein
MLGRVGVRDIAETIGSMARVPSPEQHRALLSDCWAIARALPTSGVLDRDRRPYRAIRFERKLDSVASDPIGLLEYVRGMARRTSEGLESLVEYNRLDLSVEMLILDESKIYAPLFTQEDRDAAKAKLARQSGQVEELAKDRARQLHDAEVTRQKRIAIIRSSLPTNLEQLKTLASEAADAEDAIAINSAILEQTRDVVALNRLGRAYEAVGSPDDARSAFEKALAVDPHNRIAAGRLRQLRA